MRLKLTLQYSGAPYGGWQYQAPKGEPRLPSIQGTLCEAFNKLLGQTATLLATSFLVPRDLVAAGRTDAGVHALEQVAHVDVPDSFAPREASSWRTGLNHYLPLTIRITQVEAVPDTFHARFSATARRYVYKLYLGRHVRPDLLHHAAHLCAPTDEVLDITAMQAAIASLPVGVPTDFSSFRDAECQSKNPVCTLTHAKLTQPEAEMLELHIGADHFLHHMVRNIMGTVAEVGVGKRDPDFTALLAARDRRLAGLTFSPAGLYLAGVTYPS